MAVTASGEADRRPVFGNRSWAATVANHNAAPMNAAACARARLRMLMKTSRTLASQAGAIIVAFALTRKPLASTCARAGRFRTPPDRAAPGWRRRILHALPTD